MPLWLLIAIVATVSGAVILGVQGVWWAMQTRQADKARDLSRRLGTLAEEEDRPLLFRLQVRDEAAERLGSFGQYIESLLVQAGRPPDVRRVLTTMSVLGLGGMLVFVFLTRSPFGIVGLACGAVPLLSLRRQAEQRAQKLSEQLPGALDLIARSLQAGHGLSDAIRVCAEEMPQPVAGEMGRVFEEHNLGRDFREVLANLTARNPYNFDLKIFTSSVLLQRETGGNLIEILNNIAATIRARFIFQGKVRALTAEAKFSAFILGGLPIFVAACILALRPTYLAPLLEDALGRIFFGYGICSYFFGIMVMRRIARIDA